MEFLDGRSLDHVLRHRRLTHQEACGIGAQLCTALTHAHAAGVVHRDLKPSNVMLCADGRVVIMDFGTAKEVGVNRRLTATGVMIGTQDWVASAAAAPAARTSEHSAAYRRVADHAPRAATPSSRPPVRRHRSARVESRFH
jgi:serine/threonine protein kinase